VDGKRDSVISADGVRIGLLTAGAGRNLLLVHGGMSRIEGWAPVWGPLTQHWRVTAMDRRGRGSSGDSESYALGQEYDDIAAVAAYLAEENGPVDVFAHSYGATCTLGATARFAPFRRAALYEPPGPETVPREWVERVSAMVAEGQTGNAMFSFLTEVIGLSIEQVRALRDAPRTYDVMSIVTATLSREARELTRVNLAEDAAAVACPVLLLLGANSPPWARDITASIAARLADNELVALPEQGHDAVDSAPDIIVRELRKFFEPDLVPPTDR
jgi:pimeloyl-ACP methyl ester carboxylesterase